MRKYFAFGLQFPNHFGCTKSSGAVFLATSIFGLNIDHHFCQYRCLILQLEYIECKVIITKLVLHASSFLCSC